MMREKRRNVFRVMSVMMAVLMAVTLINVTGIQASAAKQKKVVVLYFSATGTTRGAAKKIQKKTNGKLIAIKAAEPYTDNDLDYSDDDSRVTKEHESADTHRDSSVRPEIKNIKAIRKAVKQADVVYIGYPIWWGEAPHIVYTLVESVSLKNKTVVPFCTSASSGLGQSASYLQQKAKTSSKTKWLKGRNFYDVPSQKKVNKWIDTLNY